MYGRHRSKMRCFILVLLLGLLGTWSSAPAQTTPKEEPQRTVVFEMRDKPWDRVFEWLTENLNTPVVSPYKPSGTFNFIGTSKKKEYTLPEVIDILNEALLAQKYVMIRRPSSIIVVPAEDPQAIDQSLIPRYAIDELDADKPVLYQRLGRTELAQVVFPVSGQTAEEAVKDVTAVKGPFGKVTPIAQGRKLLVTDTVGNLRRVKKILDEGSAPLPAADAFEFDVIQLGTLDGNTILKTLTNAYANTTLKPLIELDAIGNRLMVRGTPAQVQEIRAAVKKFGGRGAVEEPGGDVERVRVVSLEPTRTPTAVIDALAFLWQDLRANPVEIVTQSQLEPRLDLLKRNPPKEIKQPPRPMPKTRPMPPADGDGTEKDDHPGTNGNGKGNGNEANGTNGASENSQLTDPRLTPRMTADLPGKRDRPLLLAPLARGNGIMIGSDDTEALQLADELIRYLVQPGDGETVVIALENASAVDAARVIDELYNGRQQRATPQISLFPGGGGGGPFGGGRDAGRSSNGGGSSSAASSTSSGRVRVVADPRTNALLVRAPRLEIETIRKLVEVAIDFPGTTAAAVAKTWIIKPKNATATEIATILRELYRDFLTPTTTTRSSSGFSGSNSSNWRPPFPGPGGGGSTSGSTVDSRAGTLSIATDATTNALIVSCSEPMYLQINKLVKELDDAAVGKTKVVDFYSVKNMDPTLVYQAIDAINGRRTGSTTSSRTTPGLEPIGGRREGDGSGREGDRPPDDRRYYEGSGGGGDSYRGGDSTRGGFPGSSRGGSNGSSYRGGSGGFPGGGYPGGGGRRPMDDRPEPGGPDFFGSRVMDDPRVIKTALFDPQTERILQAVAEANGSPQGEGELLALQQPEQPEQPEAGARAPRRPVTIEFSPETGQIIIIGEKEDVELVKKIFESLRPIAQAAETEIRLFPLEHADAVSVANSLTQLYQRVIVGPGGTSRAPVGQQLEQSSVIVVPLPRQNAVLVAGPRGRMKDIEATLAKLDQPIAPDVRFKTYALKKANAARVVATIQSFYAQRYSGEEQNQNQVRIQAEESTNTVVVQASPSDQEEISRLITYLDTAVSNAVNELRIVPIRSALATDIATILQQAIIEETRRTTPSAAPSQQQPGGGGEGGRPGGGGETPSIPGSSLLGGGGTSPFGTRGTTTAATKGTSLRFVPTPDGRAIQTGLLEDIRIIADARTNTLIISAPPGSIDLILALINALDRPPSARAEVKVFTLEKSDAFTMANMLMQLFFGTGAGTGLQRTGAGTFPGTGAFQGGLQRTPFTSGLVTGEGAPIVDLRIAVDQRTNSLIIAGSQSDLLLVEAIIRRLDSADIRERKNEVYKLKNTNAIDVSNALNEFLRTQINVLGQLGEITPFQQIEREVVVVPEQISNSLIISATPRFYDEVIRLIEKLDAEPPQVMIQVLIAAVRLEGSEEFGVEIGFQNPLWFQRGIFPASGFGGTISYNAVAPPGTSLISQGVSVTGTTQPTGFPGFNWNTTQALPNNIAALHPDVVAQQGISNFGVGRVGAGGIGGLVLSAASHDVNLLIRALKTQGKIEVLSRPQIMTLDNQTAFIQVGQTVPYVTTTNINVAGGVNSTVQFQPTGVILQVTPKISPDGHVVMRVDPQVSELSTTQTVSLGGGVNAPVFNITQASTTISAYDSQTVAIGGLITRNDNKQERKIPWLGDLPYVGAAFRFRTETRAKNELLIILTPRIVWSKADAERIKIEEASKMNWVLSDVVALQGPIGVENEPAVDGNIVPPLMPGAPCTVRPLQEMPVPAPMPVPPPAPAPATPPPAPQPMTQAPVLYQAPAAEPAYRPQPAPQPISYQPPPALTAQPPPQPAKSPPQTPMRRWVNRSSGGSQ